MSADNALLLIGHGSARYPDAGAPLLRHAAALQTLGRFARVEAAFLNGTPTVADALAMIKSATIRVVPFFMEAGYFSQIALPHAIRSERPHSLLLLCPPVGVHDLLAEIIERHALAACADSGTASQKAAIIVVGHGSASAPGRTHALHRHTARIAASGLFAHVQAACLEETPFLADTLAAARAYPTVVVGFFANQGAHVSDDIPRIIAAEQAARVDRGTAVSFDGAVAGDPAMVPIIQEQSENPIDMEKRSV